MLQKNARQRYQDLFEEAKSKKWQYGCDRYENLSEMKNQVWWIMEKKYYKMRKNKNASQIKTSKFLANIKNSRAPFKTHLKYCALIFLQKCKKLVFQTTIDNFLFGKLFSCLIIRNYFENSVFLDKFKEFFPESMNDF